MSVKKDNGSSNVKWDDKFRVFDWKGLIPIEGVVLHGDAIVLELVLVEEWVWEPGTKPQALVDDQDKGLTTGLASVGCCASDDWHILFANTMFCILGGDITESASVWKRHEVAAKCTSISMGIKFTLGKDWISMNGRNRWKQMVNRKETMISGLVGL